jgi:FAD/FMN-containing dehydrogenase
MAISRRTFLAGAGLVSLRTARQADPLAEFRSAFKGSIVVRGDADYDRARAIASVNPSTDKRPRLIARCSNVDDVARAIEFGRMHALEIAVRAGGHDLLGASVCDDGIVIDVSQMKSIAIDGERRTARVGAGVRSSELNAATDSHGLAAVLGCNPGVGVAGLTLGGGLGWFLGRFGAACDNLIAADLVDAEGRRRHASADENADLFWALRGGGGNFGIVTAFEYRLHPVDRVLGGLIAFRTNVAPFLRFYRDFMKAAPDALAVETSIVMLERPTILCTACWSGDLTEGERALRPLREFGPPVADAIGSVPYARLTDRPGPEFGARVFGPPPAPPPTTAPPAGRTFDYWRGGSLDDLSDGAIEQVDSAIQSASRGMSMGLGHYMHGQICQAPADATPLPRKAGGFTYFFDANWRDPARADVAMRWVNDSSEAMRRWSSARTYVNYLSSDSDESVRAAYAANYQRLTALKRKYDPSNVFHLNRNIRP